MVHVLRMRGQGGEFSKRFQSMCCTWGGGGVKGEEGKGHWSPMQNLFPSGNIPTGRSPSPHPMSQQYGLHGSGRSSSSQTAPPPHPRQPPSPSHPMSQQYGLHGSSALGAAATVKGDLEAGDDDAGLLHGHGHGGDEGRQ